MLAYDRRFLPKSPPIEKKKMNEKDIRYLIILFASILNIVLHYILFGKIGILIGLLISAEAFTSWLCLGKNKITIRIKG